VKARLVTGIGVVSAIGVGRSAFLDALSAREPVAPAPATGGEVIDLKSYPGARVVEVRGFDATRYLGDKGLRSLDRLTKLLVVAARLALHDAGFKKDGAWTEPGDATAAWPDRVGLVVSNAYGSLEAINELDRVAVLEDRRYINPARFPLTVSNTAAGYASIWEDLRALNVSVSDGNCGALDAVACADMLLDQKRADALVVGGAEAMSEALFLAFRRLGAGACLGEGAALVVLETPAATHARKAHHTLAEVIGYGTSFMGPERESALVHAEPLALERAIANALADAGVTPQEVDVVVSGVSGLSRFDDAELRAIEAALGDRVCVLAPKLVLGETLGAGGAMGMLVALALFREAASAWSSGPAQPVRGTFRGNGGGVRTAVVTSLGYYGNASALVMRAPSS
jgi:3-oxoacyl-(acyl-carrier-protein) synthase